MGLATTALYAEDDAASLHVQKADRALILNGRGVRAYLDGGYIAALAVEHGCDAAHPGYGFISESAAFAGEVADRGLIFVGPDREALENFGDKARARALAQECGVPVLDGLSYAVSLEEAREFLARHSGSAVIIKAISGGGGRGMRVVLDPAELPDAYARACSEAKAAFGTAEVYVEQFVNDARHLEIQIIGDGTGEISHIWERECSTQRRHQKVVQIAPAPGLPEETRSAMCEAVVALGQAVSYRGLGTIEFLVDASSGDFYFMEANVRLQVEHTVTEEVTGIDLVQAQLKIAQGRALADIGLTQGDVPEPQGYAIQLRVSMETVAADGNVKPAGGRLRRFEVPTGPGVRTDTCGYTGYTTNPNYGSLLAKLIVQAPGREFADAGHQADHALDDFVIEGVATNVDFLASLIAHSAFVEQRLNTRFVDDYVHELVQAAEGAAAADDAASTDVMVDPRDPLAVLEHGKSGRKGSIGALAAIDLAHEELPPGMTAIYAPMQGTVVSFEVAPGDDVYVGKRVLIMEAMKMQHEVRAQVSGTVDRLGVSPGDAIFEGHPLIYLLEADVAVADEGQAEAVDLDYIRPDLQEVFDRKAAGHDENRPAAVAKRRKTGHRTARENIADLCDEGTFVEYGSVVLAGQRRRRSIEDLIENTTGDGMVCGLGQINGDLFDAAQSRAMIMSYDYMVMAGTQGMKNHAKKDRLFEIAEEFKLPTVLFAEGGGGRPGDTDGSGMAGLSCWAFTYFARLSGLVPNDL